MNIGSRGVDGMALGAHDEFMWSEWIRTCGGRWSRPGFFRAGLDEGSGVQSIGAGAPRHRNGGV